MLKKAKLLRLLKALTEVVESSSDEDIEALGRVSVSGLAPELTSEKKVGKAASTRRELDDAEIAEIVNSVESFTSREDAIARMTRLELSKRSLEQIARKIDVPVFREDNSKKLVEKIVESTIGPRINAQAIRGQMLHR